MDFREMDQQDTKKRAMHRNIFQTPICTGKKQDVCWLADSEGRSCSPREPLGDAELPGSG